MLSDIHASLCICLVQQEEIVTEKRADIIARRPTEDRGIEDVPEWLRERLEWFQDLKFGLFLHWGPYAQWGCTESWPLVPEDTWARPDHLKPWIERNELRSILPKGETEAPLACEPVSAAMIPDSLFNKYLTAL